MITIGSHLSSSAGFLAMGKTAQSIGANTFQFFTRNPRGSRAKAMDYADAEALRQFLIEHQFGQILAHAPYTLNPASGEKRVRSFVAPTMQDDLQRMEAIPGNLYNFHPGSHVGQGLEVGIRNITEILNVVLTEEQQTTVLLETMAGKGSEIGGRFEELREIIDRVSLREKLGVCLDTCHVHDAGYDIVHDLDHVLTEFDRIIGLKRLKAIHLNDSMNPAGSRKDRHEKIGDGHIGLQTFTQIINHPALHKIPFFLETPNELNGYAAEIALLRSKEA